MEPRNAALVWSGPFCIAYFCRGPRRSPRGKGGLMPDGLENNKKSDLNLIKNKAKACFFWKKHIFIHIFWKSMFFLLLDVIHGTIYLKIRVC